MATLTLADQLWMERVVEEEVSRLVRYKKAWDAYFGRYRKPLKTRGQADDNVIVNFCRLIVDKGVSFLFGQEPRFELDETARTDAEEWLEACWRANRKMQFLQKVALNGAVCGHAFVKIVPQEGGYPKLVNLSPEYVTVLTDPDDIDTVVRYTIEYPALGRDGEPLSIRQVVEREEGGGWTVLDQVSVGNGPYTTRSEAAWPYPWPPIVDCQNLPSPNEYYGLSDIEEDVIALNDAINFILSNTARIIRFHAHPKTWGKGFEAKQLRVAVDETIVLPSPEAELHNLEMQSDLASSVELYKRLKEALHELTRVPEVATGKVESAGALSGVALQILYQPLLEKVRAKRLTYGEMLVELNRRLLEMGGFGPDNITTIHWPELLPKDILQERQAALLDQQLGVSQDTLLLRLGYDPDLERQKREAGGADLGERLLTAFERGE